MAYIIKAIQQKKVGVDREDKNAWPTFSAEDRLNVFRKCGQPCFAKPIKASEEQILADPEKTLKFPVCRPNTKTCKVSAAGLMAARRRAILTKKYPTIEKQMAMLITKLGTTDKARKDMEIKRVRVEETPLPSGKHMLTIVYTDGVKIQKPYTKNHILKKYGKYLSKALQKRLSKNGK